MKGLWGAVSGIIERKEEPLQRAKIEIFEEVGIGENQIKLLKTAKELHVSSQKYLNHQWTIFPFLFYTDEPNIKLNWENSEYRWIDKNEVSKYQTVPSLDKVLDRLL